MKTPFFIEQVNPNDTSYKLINRYIDDFKIVQIGELLFDIEGQKAAFEIYSEKEGYFYSPYKPGMLMGSVDVAYYIGESREELLELAHSLVDEIDNCAEFNSATNDLIDSSSYMSLVQLNDPMIRVAVIPGGRAYRQVQDALDGSLCYKIVGYFDDSDRVSSDCLGPIDFDLIAAKIKTSEIDRVFVATGNISLRTKVINGLCELGVKFINVIHPKAFVSNNAVLGCNIYVGPFVQIASKSIVSDGAFISAGANIEHHCRIGENTLLGPGVYLSGGVSVGNRSVLSAGVSVESKIEIGNDVFITAGKGVNKNIKSGVRIIQ